MTIRYGTLGSSGYTVANPLVFMEPDGIIETSSRALVTGQTLFTITGGPIVIDDLVSVAQDLNGATASTLQYRSAPSNGATAVTISGASASLANAAAGTMVRLHPTALTTAPAVIAASAGASLGLNVGNRVLVQQGLLTIVVGVGSSTGLWKHYLRFRRMCPLCQVTAS
jgi:hypothetical protein